MRIKILYIIDSLEVGGAEKSLLQILGRAEKIQPLVCFVYGLGKLKPSFEQSGIDLVSFGLRGKYQYWTAIRKILALIHKEEPHLIHTILARSHFIGRIAGKLARTPVVSSFVNDSYTSHRYQRLPRNLRLKLRGTQLLDRITARWAFHFIANSETIKRSVRRNLGIPDNKISVIYRGRDPSLYRSHDPDSISQLRLSLSLPKDTATILNVGRLIPQKAQKDLILAMASVEKEFQVRLLIAGEGRSRSDLTELIRELQLGENILLLGHRNDVPALLQLTDVFVFPSYYEGHPGSLVEAMFSARPIVASDISVHRETIRHKETGLLVPPENPKAISDAVLWMLRHPEEARHMGRRAREAAMCRFHIDSIANQHEKLAIEVLDRWRNMQRLEMMRSKSRVRHDQSGKQRV